MEAEIIFRVEKINFVLIVHCSATPPDRPTPTLKSENWATGSRLLAHPHAVALCHCCSLAGNWQGTEGIEIQGSKPLATGGWRVRECPSCLSRLSYSRLVRSPEASSLFTAHTGTPHAARGVYGMLMNGKQSFQ